MSSPDKIFEFNLGPNLQNIGIAQWILDLNENQWVFNFNNSNGQSGPLKIPFDKTNSPKALFTKIFNGIANFLGRSPEDKHLLLACKEIKLVYTDTDSNRYKKFLQSAFATTDSESESESGSKSTTTTEGKRKSKGRKRNKDNEDNALSPSEEKDRKIKETYRQDVLSLREQFEKDHISYDQWCALVAKKYFKLKETVEANVKNAWEIMEVCLSIRCILNIHQNTLPFMGVILALPSSNKTLILEEFRDTILSIYLDEFSLHALISNSSTKTEEQLQKSDLFPKIKNRQLITPELAPIFTRNEDDLRAILGQITRVLDGRGFVGATGAHGIRGYTSTMFTWLGAAVEIPKTVWKLLSTLGFKIYFFRPDVADIEDEYMLQDYMQQDFANKMSEIKICLYDYLKTFDAAPLSDKVSRLPEDDNIIQVKCDKSNLTEDQKDAVRYIIKMAKLLSHLRAPVEIFASKRAKYNEDDYTEKDNVEFRVDQPIFEIPTRAKDILINLALGHAISQGKNHFDLTDIPHIFKVAISSCMVERYKLLKLLIKNNGTLNSNTICRYLNFSHPTARKIMREFEAVELVYFTEGSGSRGSTITLRDNYKWLLETNFNDSKFVYTNMHTNMQTVEKFLTPRAQTQLIKYPIIPVTKCPIIPINNIPSTSSKLISMLINNKKVNENVSVSKIENEIVSKNEFLSPRAYCKTFQQLASDTVVRLPSTIVCIEKPPYFNKLISTRINLISPLINLPNYEFVPNVDIDFSFLVSDEGSRRYPLLQKRYGIFDFEWRADGTFLCATFSDNLGNKVQQHVDDFGGDEEELLRWIIEQIRSYRLTFGWGSTVAKRKDGSDFDSDLAMLHKRCKRYHIPSMVEIKMARSGKCYAVFKDPNYIHIDVCSAVSNPIMIGVNEKHGIIYNSNKLGEVSEAYGYGGKLQGLTGVDAVTKGSKEQLLAYNASDVDSTRKILQHNNYEILDLYYMISKVANIPFNMACHARSTKCWESIINNTNYEIPRAVRGNRIEYQGALVFDPERAGTLGDYTNIHSVDFTSLYPWTIILQNLSPETIFCECCKDNSDARVPVEIMDDINAWAATDHERSAKQAGHAWRLWYWVCRKRKGLLPTLLEKYVEERMKYKKVNFALQYTLKILCNSLYGCCGNASFLYSDTRVAELTTAFARRSLTILRNIAEDFDLKELYSDTDSIFLQGIRDSVHFEQFQQACKDQLLGLELEPKLLDQFLLIDSKSYIARFQEKGKTIIEKKGLQGLKSDAPKWIRQAVEQFVDDYANSKPTQCISNVKRAYNDLLTGNVSRESLKIYERLDKDPSTYKSQNHYLVRLAQEQNVTQGGRVYYLYGITEDDEAKPETDPKELSINKYLEIFETAFGKLVNLVENGKYDYYNDIVGMREEDFKEQQKAKDLHRKQDPHQEALL
jgi:DNA polymerase elongation subunit (family B)